MTRNPANQTGSLSVANRTKQQLLQELVCMKADLDREREEKNHFQLERDGMLVLKGVLEKKLQEAEAKLSSSYKEREEAEERHQVEISVYKQKLKQVLSRQQSSAASFCKPIQNQNLQVQETPALNHQVELMEQSNRYSRRLRDMEVKFDLKMRTLMVEQERRRAAALRQLKQQTRSYLTSLKEEHSRALRGEEELRTAAQKELHELKEELREAQQLNKERSAAQEKNRGLEEALEEALMRLQILRRAEEEAAVSPVCVRSIGPSWRFLTLLPSGPPFFTEGGAGGAQGCEGGEQTSAARFLQGPTGARPAPPEAGAEHGRPAEEERTEGGTAAQEAGGSEPPPGEEGGAAAGCSVTSCCRPGGEWCRRGGGGGRRLWSPRTATPGLRSPSGGPGDEKPTHKQTTLQRLKVEDLLQSSRTGPEEN